MKFITSKNKLDSSTSMSTELSNTGGGNILERFCRITTFVFDIDGVLTDGSVLLLENGLQARTMNVKDGLALQMALKNNYRVIIVSGGSSGPVMERLRYLGLKEIHLGLNDKLQFFDTLRVDGKPHRDEVLYMGDDLPDLPLMQKVGLACCPADAVREVQEAAHYRASAKGGEGCVREVIEKVLRLNGHWRYTTDVSSK